MRIEILAGTITVHAPEDQRGRQPIEITDEQDRWLTLTLVWASRVKSTTVSSTRLSDGTGLSTSSGALKKRLERLRKYASLPIKSERGTGYWIDLADVTVDALEFIDRAESEFDVPLGFHGSRSIESMRTARALWAGGPPTFKKLTTPAPEMYAKLKDLRAKLQSIGQRLLIVDDQIGGLLAERLRHRHECKVAHNLDEYGRLSLEQLKEFDLFVIDRHLSADYGDRGGEEIVEDLNRKALGIPMLMMTMKPPGDDGLGDWESSLGLARLIYKDGGDGPEADLTGLVRQIGALMEQSPAELACRQIEIWSIRARRVARKRLEARAGNIREVSQMEEDAESLRKAAAENNLAKAQRGRHVFKGRWAGDFV